MRILPETLDGLALETMKETMMRHEPKKINPKLWRCTCGSEFENEDDADEHAANAREEQRKKDRQR